MGGGGGGGGVQGGCERRIEVFVKYSKKKFFFLFFWGVGGGGGGLSGRGQVGGGGVRVDVNKKWSFCENSKVGVRVDVFGEVKCFSSSEPKAQGELRVYQSCRRLSVCVSTFSNSNISATSGPIVRNFI